MHVLRPLVDLVSRVPTRVQVKLMAAFLAIVVLLIVMGAIFFASWAGQSLGNWRTYNEDRASHDLPEVGWATYVQLADFWEKTLQNWQSEFLAVGTMVVFTIYLRQRGSPESKPVGAPHQETPG